LALAGVAKGLLHPAAYFDGFDPGKAVMGSHRNLGKHHVSILDDHDHVFGEKIRFSSEAASDHQIVAATALQLFTLGIPCLYYGSEQALTGPEASQRQFLPDWKGSDRYLRESMFGPEHPRRAGRAGIASPPAGLDPDLPGFGAFGTAGQHCFDSDFATYRRISAMNAVRNRHVVLRHGRQYLRPTAFLQTGFQVHGPGEILAWSRLLDDEEAVCVVNTHGTDSRGARVVVDASLNPPESTLTVVLNTAEATQRSQPSFHPVGSEVSVRTTAEGMAFVEVGNIPASEVLVLMNRP
jgi:glycosidase